MNKAWYKDAVIYELHVRAFFDGNNDGKGDFAGLTQKLDYLQDLGVTALWLLPFYPSPLRDDGYDISDYFNIHPDYGTLADFKIFLREAKRRGLRVITELVLNHTSDRHELFQKARQAPEGAPQRDFYVWSADPQKYPDARVIFKDFETSNWTWDPQAKAYYWHRFYSHQPDLNFDNPEVRRYILAVVDFWLALGVDGLRLDAVPYLFEQEGTNCENLPQSHDFLKELRRHVDKKFKDRMLLAEANQWPEDAAAYFGNGDECHMAFHFPLMPRLYMALHMEDSFPVIDILQQTPDVSRRGQWAIFLRNHDELTLEMVSEEDRDYMYRFYAHDPKARINLGIRRRLAPLMGNNRKKIELLNGLLFSLPGTPVLYYGDEIGMGDNIHLGDRNGVRTPMLWSADRNAGFSRANPQALYLPITNDPEYHYEAVNVSIQQNNPHSLYWWTKRILDLRKRHQAFSVGSMEFVGCDNRGILAFLRCHEGENILVVANLSRFVQPAELDLSKFKGMALVEMFGRNEFPSIKEDRYMITLGPHSFYWFRIRQPTSPGVDTALAPPRAPVIERWRQLGDFSDKTGFELQNALMAYLRGHQWFEGKSHQLRSVRIIDEIKLPYGEQSIAALWLIEADLLNAAPETYLLPIAFAAQEQAQTIRRDQPFRILAELRRTGKRADDEGILFDAAAEPAFCAALLNSIREGRRLKGRHGEIQMSAAAGLIDEAAQSQPTLAKATRRNTSIIFGDRLILKLFRRIHPGVHPDAEISRYLAEKKGFAYSPALAGEISYRRAQEEARTLGVLHAYIPNRGNAWQYALDSLRRYFEELLAAADLPQEPPSSETTSAERIGSFLETARILGRRTAELHLALSDNAGHPMFAPEGFNEHYQRSSYQTLRNRASEAFFLLRRRLGDIPAPGRQLAEQALGGAEAIQSRFHWMLGGRLSGLRIRCHGDYHLKEVLYTGNDFQIIDFEGPAAQSLQERRVKRSPLRDVAGMMRSFDYAAYTILLGRVGVFRPEDAARLEPWARFWTQWVSSTFLKSYLEAVGESPILPKKRDELERLLNIFLVDRALEELRHELEEDPKWAIIPLKGLAAIAPPENKII